MEQQSTLSSGIWTAIVTPFKDHSLDLSAFQHLLDEQAKAEVAGVVVAGTTGESPTLSVEEKLALISLARRHLPAKIQVMAGTGSSDTKQSIELSLEAKAEGADSLLVVTPPYNKPTLSGLKAHFAAIAEKAQIPVCLYHVPGRTAQRLSPQDLSELTQIPYVVGVKEASGDMGLFSRARRAAPPRVAYFSGDDPTFLPSIALGGAGVVSVISNIFPKAMVALWNLAKGGQLAEALALHEVLLPMMDALFLEANPAPTKSILAQKGLIQDGLRLPLVPIEDATTPKLNETYLKCCEGLKERGLL